jgi:Flp pilus assembly protein TadD
MTDPGAVAGIVLTYLRLLVLPWPARAYYTADQVGVSAATLLAAAAFVAACLVLPRVGGRRVGLWALAWTCAFLLPVCGLVPQDVVIAERFLYLPSVGVGLLVASAVDAWQQRAASRSWTVAAAVAALAVALGASAALRVQVWRDEPRLFAEMVRTSPRAAVPRNNLGRVLIDQKRFAEAELHLQEAVRLDPAYAEAHSNLGVLWGETGRLVEAAEAGETALRLKPEFIAARLNLVITYRQLGHCAHAIRVVETAPPVSASDPRLARQGALARAGCGSPAPAPADARDLSARGNAAADAGRTEEAAQLYRQALALDPADARTRNNLARALLKAGDEEAALRELREAVKLAPDYALARFNLGMVLARRGQSAEAARFLETVARDAAEPSLREAAQEALGRLRQR